MVSSKVRASGYCGIDLTCELVENYIDDSQQMRYTTYGIRVMDRQGNTLVYYADVSTDRDRMDDIVALCNSCGASAIHIQDILEDCLI